MQVLVERNGVAIISLDINGLLPLGKRLFAAELRLSPDEQLEIDGVSFVPNETLLVNVGRTEASLIQNDISFRTGTTSGVRLQVRKRSKLYYI